MKLPLLPPFVSHFWSQVRHKTGAIFSFFFDYGSGDLSEGWARSEEIGRYHSLLTAIALGGFLLFSGQTARGVTYTWSVEGNGGTGNSANQWNTPSSWGLASGFPNSLDDTAIFKDSKSVHAVHINAPRAVGSLQLDNNNSFSISPRGTGALIVGNINATGTGTTTFGLATTGTLNLALGTSSGLVFQNGTILGNVTGRGTIGGNVIVSGSHSVGGVGSIGTQAFTNTLSYTGTSIFNWDITGTSGLTPSPTWDKVTGAASGVGATFAVDLLGGNSFADDYWNSSRAWNSTDIFSGGGLSTFSSITSSAAASEGVFSISGMGITWTPSPSTSPISSVPETSSVFAGVLIGCGLIRRRR